MITSRKRKKKRLELFGRLGPRLPLFAICMWPGIISLLALMLANVAGEDVPGAVTTSAYPSGVSCGSNPPKQCVSQAYCSSSGRCSCPTGTHGDGTFQCYRANTIRAQIQGFPPALATFRNTRSGIIWPCRFRLTEFTTFRNRKGHKCYFQIFGVNKILGGKILLTGVEVHLQVKNDSTFIGGIGIRSEGKAKNNGYTYTERGRDEFVDESPVRDRNADSSDTGDDGSGSGDGAFIDEDDNNDFDWGPPDEMDIGDGERVFSEIDEDHFFTVSVPSCGAVIRFRAPDVNDPGQYQSSGLSLNIDNNNGPLSFKNPQTYLAETNKKDILLKNARKKDITVQQEILRLSMENAARQYSTPEGKECEDTARTFRSYCHEEQQAAAIKSCTFFLENRSLVSCLDPPGERTTTNSLNAFNLCLWQACRPSQSVCNVLKSRIQQSGCISYTPRAFSNMDCGT